MMEVDEFWGSRMGGSFADPWDNLEAYVMARKLEFQRWADERIHYIFHPDIPRYSI